MTDKPICHDCAKDKGWIPVGAVTVWLDKCIHCDGVTVVRAESDYIDQREKRLTTHQILQELIKADKDAV